MTEAHEGTNLSASYDQLRQSDFIPGKLREQWARLEFDRRRYQDDLVRLSRDEDLTAEAKERRARELEAGEARKIAKAGRDLKAALLKSAEQAARASLPIFLGETLNPSDPTKVLISQNEAARISRRIERVASQPGPFKHDASDILKEEYERGLEMGDTRGAAIIRGALMVAEEQNMDDEWVPRRERDWEYVDTARQRWHAAQSVPTQAPGVPRSLKPRRLSRRPEQRRATGVAFVGGGSAPIVKRDEAGHAGVAGSNEATAPLPEGSPTQHKKTPPAPKRGRKKAWT